MEGRRKGTDGEIGGKSVDAEKSEGPRRREEGDEAWKRRYSILYLDAMARKELLSLEQVEIREVTVQ